MGERLVDEVFGNNSLIFQLLKDAMLNSYAVQLLRIVCFRELVIRDTLYVIFHANFEFFNNI